jgi:hypothetical protein
MHRMGGLLNRCRRSLQPEENPEWGRQLFFIYSANDTEKQTLHRRITPSDEQFNEQQDRWNALADHLVADLKQRSDYLIRTWFQGYYKSATQIRPVRMSGEFDIDLDIYFQWEGEPQDAKGRSREFKSIRRDQHDRD